MRIFGTLAILLLFVAGTIYLQMRLSRSGNKYVGIVLPAISFILSLLIIIGNVSFFMLTYSSGENVIVEKTPTGDYIGLFFSMFFMFLIANIPTAIFLAIYFGERAKIDTQKAIDKMRIEDL